ncbi:AraC family transcriptional regulator [Pigmentiphaga sp. H8]|uniref:helix-turn-helix domain-containing protein n=1 Tax=Pigmentiphaga sp. H8 TaxID=2488560 RepID=UPI000F5B29DC|nr:AraC family transcriptional regulator [Pigmentiphaga sp. H8]AZG07530.1 AraC family transcriptional regulator [Pigmentiphaga sp. H8]
MNPLPVLLPVDMAGEPLCVVVREGQAGETSLHTHACGQLLYPERGATLLQTEHHLVRLGPSRAAWIPPDLPHAVLMERPYRYHSVYVDAAMYAEPAFSVTGISPLLRELIFDAGRWDTSHADAPSRHWKTQVILDEIRQAPRVAAGLPIPEDARIAQICRALEADPSDGRTLAEWAAQAGASEKTMQRIFVKLTGLSFQQWRNHARMTRAIELHSLGRRMLDIAVELGYSSEGAYSHAFRQFYGYSPSQLKRKKTEAP